MSASIPVRGPSPRRYRSSYTNTLPLWPAGVWAIPGRARNPSNPPRPSNPRSPVMITSGAAATIASGVRGTNPSTPASGPTSIAPSASRTPENTVFPARRRIVSEVATYTTATRGRSVVVVASAIAASICSCTAAAIASPSGASPKSAATARIFSPGAVSPSNRGKMTTGIPAPLTCSMTTAGEASMSPMTRVGCSDRIGSASSRYSTPTFAFSRISSFGNTEPRSTPTRFSPKPSSHTISEKSPLRVTIREMSVTSVVTPSGPV